MNVLAIDPGQVSAWALMTRAEILAKGRCKMPTFLELAREIARNDFQVDGRAIDRISIEHIGHYGTGMAVGRDVFDTCIQIGRLQEILDRRRPELVKRQSVKAHLCGRVTANDSNVRQAVIDRFGGDAVAIGGKKCRDCKGKGWKGRGRPTCPTCGGVCFETPPGPLHGVASHEWSAIAVGLYYLEKLSKGA